MRFVQKIAPKKTWSSDPGAFERLLAWLDEGSNSEGQKYLVMRERLVAFFDRKNCLAPDDLADEVLNRVARRLQEEGSFADDPPARYCYIVARFVFHEYLRRTEKDELLNHQIRRRSDQGNSFAPTAGDENELKERMLDCLDGCTDALDDLNRKIIFGYYIGKERVKIDNRRALAADLGITVNALSIRACRIRDKLEGCVRNCVGNE
jgi:DNA-directed RNA polymerase specialized sigma24 family protein